MNIEDIRRVLIVGAGTMGQQIGLQCAMHGYQVMLYDIDLAALDTAQTQIKMYTGHLTAQGRLAQGEVEAVLARIIPTSDPQQAAEADLLSESVPEDPALKGKILAQFNDICPAHTLFTTNTSTLLPSMFAEATGRPAQFAAFHFHQFVWESNVVDIMPHPGTAAETVALLELFARRIGQIPIVLKKENYGYVFNAMLSALNRAALSLAAGGVASVEDVDRAWMVVMKTRIGPFGILDVIGLETAWDITEYWAKALHDHQLQANADFLKNYIEQNRLGLKNGQGFYTYPNPVYQQPGFLTGE
ncbi:MAG: 3-hydroxyacyl-CoA dehydrogenase [Anaerolineales bacterium]|nr:3-hydroxyacyl-CoA dehydrogenase [Anaerolineales bacterium]